MNNDKQRGIAAIAAIEWFLRDIKERVARAKELSDSNNDEFGAGLFMGYNEALSMMESRAKGLGVIPDDDEE